MFNLSILKVLGRDGSERPWRWNPEPVYGNGPMQLPTVAGVKQEADGVFILLSDEIISILRANMTQADKDELLQWIDRRTEAQCAIWHVPVWAGQSSAVAIHIPAAIWNNPEAAPPAKVRNYLQHLWMA